MSNYYMAQSYATRTGFENSLKTGCSQSVASQEVMIEKKNSTL